MVAKDMSFYTVDAMYLINQHHSASAVNNKIVEVIEVPAFLTE